MKFSTFNLQAFGGLKDLHAEHLDERALFVFLGGNESGKSTLREFLTSMLYGFAPAERAIHDFAPRDGSAPQGSARLVRADGAALDITRRLRHAPQAQFAEAGAEGREHGNLPLPGLGAVPRELYRGTHSLGAADLGEPDESWWQIIEERLLGGRPPRDLVTARAAQAALAQRRRLLWQDHGRGDTRERRLALTLRRLERERSAAATRGRRLLELRELIAGRCWHIQATQEQLLEIQARLRRVERLLPVLRALDEIEGLRRSSSERLQRDDLPEEARELLAARRESAAQAQAAAQTAEQSLAEQTRAAALPAAESAVLAVEDELRELIAEAAVHHQDVVHVNDLDREGDAQRALFDERATQVFTRGLEAAERDTLLRLRPTELAAHCKAWEDARRRPELAAQDVAHAQQFVKAAETDLDVLGTVDAERKLRSREEGLRGLQAKEDLLKALRRDIDMAKAQATRASAKLKAARGNAPLLRGVGLITAALAVGLTLLTGGSTAYVLLGSVAGALLIGGVLALRGLRGQNSQHPDEVRADAQARECARLRTGLELADHEQVTAQLEKARQGLAVVAARPELERRLVTARQQLEKQQEHFTQAEQQCEAAARRVAEFLAGLPIVAARLASPGTELLHDLEELRTLQREQTRLSGEREAVARRVRERQARSVRLTEQLALPSNMDAAPLWNERLQRALTARRQAQDAQGRLPALGATRDECAARLALASRELQALESRLAALDPAQPTPAAGLAWLEQARAWRAQASALEQALHERFPDWRERGEEARAAVAAGEVLELSSADQVALQRQLEQLEAALQALRAELQALGAERDTLAEQRDLADVDGAIEALREERQEVARAHDRLALAAAVLGEAECRRRERYEPAVLGRAAEHLAAFTDGAWTRLSVEHDEGGRRLWAHPRGSAPAVAVAQLSSLGLREQCGLALRLAAAQALDGEEPLPLLLDEVFSHWDPERTERGLQRLAEVGQGEGRQILLLTSRPEQAESWRTRAAAGVSALPGLLASSPRPSRARAHKETNLCSRVPGK
ncbi:MAG: AAA family ATPase [Planctomycetota bacterium]